MTAISEQFQVFGRVQGVGYRAFVQREAAALGLRGWARNRNDGSVEIVLTGPAAKIDAALAQMEHGPAGASVSRIARRTAATDERALLPAQGVVVLPSV